MRLRCYVNEFLQESKPLRSHGGVRIRAKNGGPKDRHNKEFRSFGARNSIANLPRPSGRGYSLPPLRGSYSIFFTPSHTLHFSRSRGIEVDLGLLHCSLLR